MLLYGANDIKVAHSLPDVAQRFLRTSNAVNHETVNPV
jgi:hypothetical protein